jgi:hypothetical protein
MDLYRAIEDYAAEKAAQLAAKAAEHVTAAAEEAVADEHAGLLTSPAVAAAAAAVAQAGERPGVVVAAGRLQARPSTSAGAVCSGLLAAVRGAVGEGLGSLGRLRGTAAAAVAGTAAAAAAGADGDDDDLLSDDEEVEGPAQMAATAAVNRPSLHDDQQWHQSQEAQAQLLPQSVGGAGVLSGGSMAAAAEATGPMLPQQQQCQQQGVSGSSGGRYSLRQRRSPNHTAGR